MRRAFKPLFKEFALYLAACAFKHGKLVLRVHRGEKHILQPVSYTHLDVYKRQKKYWVFGVLMVALSFAAILITNRIFNPFMPYFEILPLFFNWWVIFMYLGFMGLIAVVLLAVFYLSLIHI